MISHAIIWKILPVLTVFHIAYACDQWLLKTTQCEMMGEHSQSTEQYNYSKHKTMHSLDLYVIYTIWAADLYGIYNVLGSFLIHEFYKCTIRDQMVRPLVKWYSISEPLSLFEAALFFGFYYFL